MKTALFASWHGTGRTAQCPPDPAFPNGRPIDLRRSDNQEFCEIELQHPAPECGMWIVECVKCGKKIGLTAAGRPDDPSTIKVGCPAK